MKKLLGIILIFTCLTAFRQVNSRHITGKVLDEQNLPIPDVTVKVQGTANITQTDANGKYAIEVPDGYSRLYFSFIGYSPQVIDLGKKDVVDVIMRGAGSQLNEVVVTGYGASKNVAGKTSAYTTSAQIVGKVAGLEVRSNANMAYSVAQVPSPVYPGEESYKKINESGFALAKDIPLSTFSVDVDGASYSNIRRYINNGQLPPADAVRVEEMLNYFSYNLPGPAGNDPVAIHTELSTAPWNTKHRLLRIGLKARTIPTEKLPPSNLVFFIDVSGSMNMPNKLPLVKAAMKMLADGLRPADKVSIVTYAGMAGIELQPVHGDKTVTIDSAIDALNAMGSTNGGEGIKWAYSLARKNFIKNGNNRIIMATDGDFNVGASSDEDMETLITKERESNVDLSILGFGMGNVKDSKMETLADKGNGNYFYIDNIDEARKALVSEFGGTMFTVAKDVKLQAEFNPAKVQAYRLIGYEKRLLNKEDFNDDKKDAGDMGSGHTVTALYEIVPAGVKDDVVPSVDPLKYQKNAAGVNYSGSDELLTIKFRYKQPQSMQSKLSQTVVKDTPELFGKTSADFKFAAAVAEFGMLLRDSQYKQNSSYDEAISMAEKGKDNDKDGYRSEFIRLAKSAKLIKKTVASQY